MKKLNSKKGVLALGLDPNRAETQEFDYSLKDVSTTWRRTLWLLFFTVAAFSAQAVTLAVTSTTESRCLQNGTITLSASAGTAPYQYRVKSGPGFATPGSYQTSNVITNVQAGTFIVEVKDATGALATASATVAGSYAAPTFVIDSIKHGTCPCTGKIYAKMSGGRTPYKYKIRLNGTTTWGTPQASNIFTNVCAGTWDVQAEDSCGNFQTIMGNIVKEGANGPLRFKDTAISTYTLTNVAPQYVFSPIIARKPNCATANFLIGQENAYVRGLNKALTDFVYQNATFEDTGMYSVPMIGGQPPYTYTLTSSNGYSATKINDNDFRDIPATGLYSWKVVDQCGTTYSAKITADPFPLNKNFSSIVADCENDNYILYINQNNQNNLTFGNAYYYTQDSAGFRSWSNKSTYNYTNSTFAYGTLTPTASMPTYNQNGSPQQAVYGIFDSTAIQQHTGTYPKTYQLIAGPGSPSIPKVINSPLNDYYVTFMKVTDPTATYIVKAVDACGQVVYDTISGAGWAPLPLQFTKATLNGDICPGYDQRLLYFTGSDPTALLQSWTSTPAGGSVLVVNATTLASTPALGGSYSVLPYHYLSFKRGYEYNLIYKGNCTGDTTLAYIDARLLDTVQMNLSAVYPPCSPGASTGSADISTFVRNFNMSGVPVLFSGTYNPDWTYANRLTTPTFSSNWVNNGTIKVSGLAPGTYTVMSTTWYAATSLAHCRPYVTFTIPDYVALSNMECIVKPICSPDTTGLISAINALNGKLPYTYQIKKSSDPASAYSASQASPTFTKTVGTYDIRVSDACLNSYTASGTLSSLSAPSLSSATTTCIGSDIVITASKLYGVKYEWYKAGVLQAGQNTHIFTKSNSVSGDAGIYTCKITDTIGSCGSLSSNITIALATDPNPATINLPNTLCEGSMLSLVGGNTTAPAPTTGLWTLISGPTGNTANIVNKTIPSTSVSPLIGDKLTPYIFRWQYTTSAGCVSMREDSVKVLPKPNFIPGSNIYVCNTTTTVLTERPLMSGYVGRWTKISGPSLTIANTANPASAVSGIILDSTYRLRWTVSNVEDTTMCSTIHEIYLKSSSIPTFPNAGKDTLMCGGSDVFKFSGNAVTSGSGKWIPISWPSAAPTPTITSPTTPTGTVTLSVPGTYKFGWTISNGGDCPLLIDTMVITRVTSKAGVDISTCINSSTPPKLTAYNPGAGYTVGWTIAGNSPKQGPLTYSPNAQTDTARLAGYTPGTYYLVWTVSAPGCTATDTMVLNIYNQPTKPNAGVDQMNLCKNAVTLTGTLGAAKDSVAFKYWSKIAGPASSFSKYDTLKTSASLNSLGTYIYQLEIFAPGCASAYDTVVVSKTATPPTLTLDSVKKVNCPGVNIGAIYLSATPASPNYEYRINSGAWQNSPTFSGLSNGTYMPEVRNTANLLCSSSTLTPAVISTVNTAPVANAGLDTNVCVAKSITIGATTVTGNTYLWSSSLGLSSTTISNPVFSLNASGTYRNTLK